MSPSSSKKNNTSILAVLVVIVLGIFYAFSGSDPFGIFTKQPDSGPTQVTVVTTKTPQITGTRSPSNDSSWWQVYFVSPQQISDKLAQS